MGVVLLHEAGVTARFFGEEMPGEIDGRKARAVVSDSKTYDQWVQYWRWCTDTAATLGSKPHELLNSVRSSLIGSSKNNFVVVDGGTLMVAGAEDKDPSALLSYLYNEIVEVEADAPQSEKIDLDRRTQQLITEVGLSRKPLYMHNPKIEVLNRRGKREKVSPSYLYIGRNYNVIETINLHSSSEKSAQRAVDATQYMYERLEGHARTANRKNAVFASVIDARPEKYTYDLNELIELLGSWGPVINVAEPDRAINTLDRIAQT